MGRLERKFRDGSPGMLPRGSLSVCERSDVMCGNTNGRSHGEGEGDGSVRLSRVEAAELCKALQQMDLLLQARKVEPGLQALVTMLRHLRMLRRTIRAR